MTRTITLFNNIRNLIRPEIKLIRSVPLSGELKSALIGFLLTDAGAYRTNTDTGNTRIEWSFGSKQASFAEYVYSFFSNFINTPVKSLPVLTNSVVTTQYRLKTVALPIFNVFREIFYERDEHTGKWRKIVPHDMIQLMDPVVLAFIIIGDGNFNVNRIRIYLNAFTIEEVQIICLAMQIKLGINAVVRHDRNNQYIIVIPSKELDKTRKTVIPYLHQSMIYRIGYPIGAPSS